MVIHQREGYSYGQTQADLHEYLMQFSVANGYAIEHFADAICKCGNKLFQLHVDDMEGVASRICTACGTEHYIGDSAEYLVEANFEQCQCLCGNVKLAVSVGVALYRESKDVKWVYIGGYCPECDLVACYGHWKNEYLDYIEYLARV
jgi:hypothetical protein